MRVIVLLCLFLWPGFALAEEPTITVTVGDQTRIFTRDQLLARPDAATIQVPRDITYRVPILPCRAGRVPARRHDTTAQQRHRGDCA